MNTQEAYKELREELQRALNDTSNPTISEFLPEYGEGLEEDYCDEETGRQKIRKFNRTEEEAIKEAQQTLLYGNGVKYLDELFLEGTMRNKVVDFLTALAKEIVEC